MGANQSAKTSQDFYRTAFSHRIPPKEDRIFGKNVLQNRET